MKYRPMDDRSEELTITLLTVICCVTILGTIAWYAVFN